MSETAGGALAAKELALSDTSAEDISGSLCPPEDSLIELAMGRLRGGAAAEIRAHTRNCQKCSKFLSELRKSAAESSAIENQALSQTAGGQPSLLDPEKPAQFVAEFRLVRALGQGAMGQVFLAHDTFLDRLVAVKLMTASESTPTARERFFVEARAVARLAHPNVVTLYRAGEEQGKRYLVSEFVQGQSLERLDAPLPWQKVLEIGLGLSRGLAAAHERGVLHRDIKPANTMMTQGGEVKLLDFGLAKLVSSQRDQEKPALTENAGEAIASLPEALHLSTVALTRTGMLLGTPLYMAPEIWREEPATTQTDVYSLGAMLYELCTGNPPHLAATISLLKDSILDENAKPLAQAAPTVDARLAAVIESCLQRDPAKRPISGLKVRDALERIASKSAFISRRAMAILASFLAVLFVVFGGVAVMRDRQAKKQAVLAQRLGQEIKDMEWTLRSARQLPLHDLDREKAIVRKRMAQLEAQMLGYGSLGRGLAHYALGRGHLALHEYPQALRQIEQAMQLGYQSADAHYALGRVLGLHYKQAKAELLDSGPSSLDNQRKKPLEARYLTPAIAALNRSRQMKHDAPRYVEGLIAFYQGNYEAALQHADAALNEAPWLYEAATLAGDVYVERGEYAKAKGLMDEMEKELVRAVQRYEQAAAIGKSDAELYENLATAWLGRMHTELIRGQPLRDSYFALTAALDKSHRAEPGSIRGRLMRMQATRLLSDPTIAASGTVTSQKGF